jgi:hypothetical protein
VLCDGEAQAGAAVPPGGRTIGLTEHLEKVALRGGCNANAGEKEIRIYRKLAALLRKSTTTSPYWQSVRTIVLVLDSFATGWPKNAACDYSKPCAGHTWVLVPSICACIDLLGNHLEMLEKIPSEGHGNRNIACVAASTDQDPADAAPVMARVESMPV